MWHSTLSSIRALPVVPEDYKQIRYVENKPEYFPVPPSKTQNYTIVEIQILPGRSLAEKRLL